MKKKHKKGLGSTREELSKKVQLALDAKQAKKEYKDVGTRVTGSKKEKMAYKVVRLEDLKTIEEDATLAQSLVVKEKVYPIVDVAAEREKGVSAGAAYLKMKLRESCANKAPNNVESRAAYTKTIARLSSDLEKCYSVSDIEKLVVNYKEWPIREKLLTLVDPNMSEEQVQRMQAFTYSYSNSKLLGIYDRLFGKTFTNLFFANSEAAHTNWQLAKTYEPLSVLSSDALISMYKANYTKRLDGYKETLAIVNNAKNIKDLKPVLDTLVLAKGFVNDFNTAKHVLTTNYLRWIDRSEKALENVPSHYYPHDNDWSWYDGDSSKKSATRSNERQINAGIPLTHIKRTGGITIPEKFLTESSSTNFDNNPIVSTFGFHSVQFGNAISNTESREHIRHFLGAIVDLAEILDIDLKQFNQIGKLSIAFASRGKGKAYAHYEPGLKIINLTNKRGDGSLCHEWGHYLDNIICMLDNPDINTTAMASMRRNEDSRIYGRVSNYAQNISVRGKMDAIMRFIDRSKYKKSSAAMNSKYWIAPVELFARAWETYVYDKLSRAGRYNNYLVNVEYFNDTVTKKGLHTFVYPVGDERNELFKLYDSLITTIKEQYYLGSFKPFSTKRADEYIDLIEEPKEPAFIKQLLGFKRLLEAV